ncbi:hypothetical protein CBL_05430 [Carabus blaptoides fortunei]
MGNEFRRREVTKRALGSSILHVWQASNHIAFVLHGFDGFCWTSLLFREVSSALYDMKKSVIDSFHTQKITERNALRSRSKLSSIDWQTLMTQEWNKNTMKDDLEACVRTVKIQLYEYSLGIVFLLSCQIIKRIL